jgi:hypothetical protein
MKICAYCGRENDESAASCRECGTDEFGIMAPPEVGAKQETVSTDPYQARTLTAEQRKQTFAVLERCRTLDDASLLVARLKAVNIDAFVPDEALFSTLAWNANAYGFVRVSVPTEQYESASEFLTESSRSTVAFASEQARRTQSVRLSWPMRLLFLFVPITFCPGLVFAAFVCEWYRKKGYTRRTEEAYLLLLIGTAFWISLWLILALSLFTRR